MNTNFYSLWFDSTGNRTSVDRVSSRRSIHSTTDRLSIIRSHESIIRSHENLSGCSVRRNAIFSSSGAASGAVSSKLDAEVPKVAEKDALRHLKAFFVSFALKYANKEKKTLGSLRVQMTPFFGLFEIAQNLRVNGIVVCDLRRHFRTDFRHLRVFSGI